MADEPAEETTEDGPKKSKKKLFIIVGLVVVLGAGGFMFMGGGGSKKADGKTTTTLAPPVVLGIVKLDPLVLSLSDGSYLKMDLSIEVVKRVPKEGDKTPAPAWEAEFKAEEFKETDGEIARSAAANTLLHYDAGQLSSGEAKAKAKEEVTKAIEKAYEGSVHEVLFGDFVLQ